MWYKTAGSLTIDIWRSHARFENDDRPDRRSESRVLERRFELRLTIARTNRSNTRQNVTRYRGPELEVEVNKWWAETHIGDELMVLRVAFAAGDDIFHREDGKIFASAPPDGREISADGPGRAAQDLFWQAPGWSSSKPTPGPRRRPDSWARANFAPPGFSPHRTRPNPDPTVFTPRGPRCASDRSSLRYRVASSPVAGC